MSIKRSLNNSQIGEINCLIAKIRQSFHNIDLEIKDLETKLETMKTQFCAGFCKEEKNVDEFQNDCQCYKCGKNFCDLCQFHEEEEMKLITQSTQNKYDVYRDPDWEKIFDDDDWQCSICWKKEVDLFLTRKA